MEIPEEIKKIIKENKLDAIDSYWNKKDYFILDENKNVIPASLIEWGTYLEEIDKRIVKKDMINDLQVSTVFVGMDMNGHFLDADNISDYKPAIFETMIFPRDGGDIYCDRYATWKEAEEGHQKAVQWVKDGCKEEVVFNEK